MDQEFTQNQLIRYIYKETSTVESMVINEAIQDDYQMKQAYEELLEGYKQMPKAKFDASDDAIQNILKYSEASAVEMH